jgi:hypothetical protein
MSSSSDHFSLFPAPTLSTASKSRRLAKKGDGLGRHDFGEEHFQFIINYQVFLEFLTSFLQFFCKDECSNPHENVLKELSTTRWQQLRIVVNTFWPGF